MTEHRRRDPVRALRVRIDRARRDRGASSIELVLYTPILMLVIFLTVQFALTWYGNEVAGAVARETARVVRVGGGTPASLAEAQLRAQEYSDAIGGASFRELEVQITQPDPLTVRVTVSGRSLEIVNGFAPRVSATVQGPVEQFRPDS